MTKLFDETFLIGGIAEVVLIEDVEEFGTGHGTRVTTDGTEDAEEFSAFAILRRGHVLEVVKRPVEDVAVEMVDLHAFWTRSEPSTRHKIVAVFAPKMAHGWVLTTGDSIGRFPFAATTAWSE